MGGTSGKLTNLNDYMNAARGVSPGLNMNINQDANNDYMSFARGQDDPVAKDKRQRQVGSPNAPLLQSALDIGAGKMAPLVLAPAEREKWQPTPTVAALAQPAGTMPNPGQAAQDNYSAANNRQALWQAFYDKVNSDANPYGSGALKDRLAGIDAEMNGNIASAQQQTRDDFGARGMLGSGQELGAANVLNAEKALAMTKAHSQAIGDYQDKFAQFETNRAGRLAQLLSGDYTGADTSRENAATLGLRADNLKLGNDMNREQIKQLAMQNGINEATYESQVQAAKAGYDAAAASGKLDQWMSQNAGWLGPLKAIFGAGVAVASAAASNLK
jgi:hypothetical protein